MEHSTSQPDWRRAVRMARSGFRRYPKALTQSLITPAPGLASAEGAQVELVGHETAGVWLGHATVLLRVAGLTILTDPVLSERIGMRLGRVTLGLDRLRPPAMDVASLPPIDVVVISHAHFDHLDRPTLEQLASPETTVLTAKKTARLIPSGFGSVIELGWGQQLSIGGVVFTAVRPAHWGARGWLDTQRGFNGYLMEGGDSSVFFAGDTAYTESFSDIGPVDLAIMGIGAYDPWIHAHANPEQAWAMTNAMRAQALMPVHHSTFQLSDEHIDEPMERLIEVAGGDEHRVVARQPGELWTPDLTR